MSAAGEIQWNINHKFEWGNFGAHGGSSENLRRIFGGDTLEICIYASSTATKVIDLTGGRLIIDTTLTLRSYL